jgi:5-hydroxyisourate hydrolase
MNSITTHVLDTARGRPAAGVVVVLELKAADGAWRAIGNSRTDEDGRVRDGLAPAGGAAIGTYRLHFATGEYFRAQGHETFYPEVIVTFRIQSASEHHHVPLLLAPFGYSTYRGS